MSNFQFLLFRIGLEQELAMPDGSPVLDYLVDLKRHLSVGPPVMFVVNSTQLDYADPKVQNALCGGEGCNADSLQAQARLSIELNCPRLMVKSIIHHVIYKRIHVNGLSSD